jgi:hypothetical protein
MHTSVCIYVCARFSEFFFFFFFCWRVFGCPENIYVFLDLRL